MSAEQKKPAMQQKSMHGVATEKPKNMWTTSKRLIRVMTKSNLLIVLALVSTIAGTVMQVYTPKRLGAAITVIFDGLRGRAGIDFDAVLVILLTVGAMMVGVFITTFLQQRLMVVVAQKATYKLRNELKAKMSKVPVSYFDKNANGNLMSVAANDVDNIVTNLQESLTTLVSGVVLLVGFFWMMITISPLLTGLACLIIPCSVLIIGIITPKTKKYTKSYYGSLGELNTQIEETYQGFSVVKSFNGEDAAIVKFGDVNANMVTKGRKSRFLGGMMFPSMGFVQNVIYVLLAIVGSVNVVSGAILIGDLTAFLQYSSQFSTPIMKISQSWGNFLAMLASAERVFNMLDAEEMVEYKKEFPNNDAETAKVVFDHVKFGYTDELLMKDFCMEVHDGQMVAIVGHTGAGKTTLINLLERFYEIQDGGIRIDGTDIRNERRDTLRRQIGMVLQDTWLFSGTIFDNIKYGNDNATDEQVYAAAKAAYADDFIQKLPDGYNTVLNEDADNISQGQRQLITIARAFVSNPEILILDEATSNVDSRTEMVIQSAMKRLLKGRTSFVVAHRLSTIYDADRILVMDNGDIVETGEP
jgi:ATP-binding cassette subfamily B protein